MLDLDMNPQEVKLPGSLYAGTVATASDKELTTCLAKDLAVIEGLLADWGAKPDADGYASPEWYELANATRSMHATESNVRRAERRVRAIRKELADRAERAKADREAKVADARLRLERLADEGAQAVEFAVARVERVLQASNRVRAFVHDLKIMGGGTRMGDQINQMREGIAAAAQALGKPVPEMAETPEGLPTNAEVQEALALFMGARNGFDTVWTPPAIAQDAGKAHELERILKQLG